MNSKHQEIVIMGFVACIGSEEYRRLFGESMKEGFIEALINKIVIYGAAGTGKSSFMDLVVGNPPADIRRSTPLAARPVSVFQIDAANKKWVKLSSRERKEIMGYAILSMRSVQDEQGGDTSSDEDAESGDEESISSDHPPPTNPVKTEAHTTEADPTLHPTPSSPTARTTRPGGSQTDEKALLKSISSCEDLVVLVEQCSRTGQAITSYRKILFVDSGGQPQFHEMLPAFLRRMNLYVFVFKLSEELASKPVVEYYDSRGEAVGTPYESAHTNEQLLQHCLRTLHTHRATSESEGKSSKIMIVGTHRDKEGECTTETRKEKNEKLASLLLPAFKDQVLYSNLDEKEFVFAVNARDPQLDDKALVEKIQHLILTDCSPEPVRVPLRYFCLEIILEEVSQSLGRGVLSIEECQEAAAELHFDNHTLDAALQFLDEISVVFYFPEVLGGVLFANPQVLLDKATELVEKIYCLRKATGGSECVVSAKWQAFKEHALFTVEFLGQEEFNKHYIPGLFTPVELVKLFRRLLIIAEFSKKQYFMPALLEVLGEEEVGQYRVAQDSPAAALALDFPLGGPRLGTYCTLVCYLVSHNNQHPCPWVIDLLPDSNTPTCLYRNCVQFSVPGFPGCVTLIDTFTHFEVHVSTAMELSTELCSVVRQAIFAGVRKATHTLGYNNCTPSVAVLCPCGVGSLHVATVGKGLWICKKNNKHCGKLSSSQQVWEENTLHSKGKT